MTFLNMVQNTVMKMENQSVDYVYRLFCGKVITLDKKVTSAELIHTKRVVPHGEIENKHNNKDNK